MSDPSEAAPLALAAHPAQPSDPWYAAGLRFECTGCGRCCSNDGGYVWASVREIRALARRLGLDVDAFGRRYLRRVGVRYALLDGPGGSCVFLEGRSCGVYEDRPAQCRSFPWWPAHLQSPEDWQRAAQSCEGIREDAPLHPVSEIEVAVATARAAGLTELGSDRGDGRPEAGR